MRRNRVNAVLTEPLSKSVPDTGTAVRVFKAGLGLVSEDELGPLLTVYRL